MPKAEGERLSQMVRGLPTAGTVSKRFRDERGFTLIETLVVVFLLLVVIGALVDGFVSATHAEVDQVARASDQQAVREALVRLSKDIHCATGAGVTNTLDPVTSQPTAGLLNLQIQAGSCIAVTTAASGTSGVQWCTAAIGASGKRYALYRTDATPGRHELRPCECELPGRLPHQAGHLVATDVLQRAHPDDRGRHADESEPLDARRPELRAEGHDRPPQRARLQ